ncbi:MAG: OsmC family protein [Promethearchaeota archaeon]
MVHEENTFIKLKLDKNLIFTSPLELENLKNLIIDESIEEGVERTGPDAATLLGLAITSCLSASFIFCLQKRNLTLDDLEAIAEVSFKKNEKGYIRIKKIDVKICPKTNDPDVLKRISQCTKVLKNGNMFFEESCIITPSVEEGIDVDVKVEI